MYNRVAGMAIGTSFKIPFSQTQERHKGRPSQKQHERDNNWNKTGIVS